MWEQSPFVQSKPPDVQVKAALAGVRNNLLSLWALTAAEPTAGPAPVDLAVAPWIRQSAAQLTPEQRHFNQLLFAAFGSALLVDETAADFPSYLAALTAQPVDQLHVRLAQSVEQTPAGALRTSAQALLADPANLQRQIVDHLRTLWDELLAAEWQRHQFTLAGMTRSINELIFSQPRWQAMSAFAALRVLLQTEPSDQQLAQAAGVRCLVLVWSPHLLGYCSRLGSSDTLWVLRPFDPQLMRRDPLSRAEVLRPLTALADETRLRILELLTEHGEQRAQEIITQVESSQGNVSRHLKQLVGSGFVRERRAGDANKHYELDDAGLHRLIFLLRGLLSNHNAQAVGQQQQAALQLAQVRAAAPPRLHDFLDEQGRITRWSNKLKDQDAMMEYLIHKFEPERAYNEKQVNELLQQWYLDADFVLIRRSMVDAGLLRRTKDGARYWR